MDLCLSPDLTKPWSLRNVIGRCQQHSKSSLGVILARRRAPLPIEDYRRIGRYERPRNSPISSRPADGARDPDPDLDPSDAGVTDADVNADTGRADRQPAGPDVEDVQGSAVARRCTGDGSGSLRRCGEISDAPIGDGR